MRLKKQLITCTLFILFLFSFSVLHAASEYEGKIVSKVQFKGLNKLKADKLKASLFLLEKMPFKDDNAQRDLKNLYSFGYFNNIQLDIVEKSNKLILTYIVIEKPWIASIEVRGNDDLNDDNILKLLSNKEEAFYNPFVLKNDTKAIIQEYVKEGYIGTQVDFQTLKGEKKGELILRVNIREGQEIYIQRINIQGTRYLSPDLLRDAMPNITEPMVLGLKHYPFDKIQFEADKGLLVQAAKNKGFKNFQVTKTRVLVRIAYVHFIEKLQDGLSDYDVDSIRIISLKPELEELLAKKDYKKASSVLKAIFKKLEERLKTNEWPQEDDLEDRKELQEEFYSFRDWAESQIELFKNIQDVLKKRLGLPGLEIAVEFQKEKKGEGYYIQMNVDEGKRYLFNGVKLKGNKKISTKDIMEGLDLEQGEIYNQSKFTNFVRSTYIDYQSDGFFYAKLTPIPKVNEDKTAVSYHIDIYEGDKVHIENMYIIGNTKSKTYVVDRELRIKEGEIYDLSKLLRSRERLMKSQIFSNAIFEPRAGSEEGLVDLYWKLEEAKTGMLTLGGGYGTLAGVTMFGQISELNLFGRGYSLSLRGQYGEKSQSITASFGNKYLPWAVYTPVSWNFSVAYSWSKLEITPRYDRNGDGVWDKYYDDTDDGVYNPTLHSENTSSNFDNYYDVDRNGNGNPGEGADESGYDDRYIKKKSVTLGLSLGYAISEYWGIGGGHSFSFAKYYEATGINGNLYEDEEYRLKEMLEDGGFSMTTRTSIGISYDSSNHPLTPTKGFVFGPSIALYGLAGGYNQFSKLNVDVKGYISLISLKRQKWNLVWANYISFTSIGALPGKEDPELYAEYRLGFDGMRELRGWEAYVDEDNLKGLGKVSFGSELRMPIPGTNNLLWWAFFFDAGNVSQTSLSLPTKISEYKFSAGFGLKIEIPMFPIRLYWAQKYVAGNEVMGMFERFKDPSTGKKTGLEFLLSISGFF